MVFLESFYTALPYRCPVRTYRLHGVCSALLDFYCTYFIYILKHRDKCRHRCPGGGTHGGVVHVVHGSPVGRCKEEHADTCASIGRKEGGYKTDALGATRATYLAEIYAIVSVCVLVT